MGTLAEKWEYFLNSKELIRQSIINKGVEVSENNSLRSYKDKIAEIKGNTNTEEGTAYSSSFSIAEKKAYLLETINLIKQAIIDQGVSVLDTDTFRDYADRISEIETEIME